MHTLESTQSLSLLSWSLSCFLLFSFFDNAFLEDFGAASTPAAADDEATPPSSSLLLTKARFVGRRVAKAGVVAAAAVER
jgi:hypothetical protein